MVGLRGSKWPAFGVRKAHMKMQTNWPFPGCSHPSSGLTDPPSACLSSTVIIKNPYECNDPVVVYIERTENVSERDIIERKFQLLLSTPSRSNEDKGRRFSSDLHWKTRKENLRVEPKEREEAEKTLKADSKAIMVLWGITPWTRKRLPSSSYTAHTKRRKDEKKRRHNNP